ncbi:rod shape-determining protein RodA [candidate division WWE3 bacterium]|nr:rod shape-determining protein RodA [candidate division WWE3 bacterium]
MQSKKKINWFLAILPILIFSLGETTLISTHPDLSTSQIVFFLVGYIVFWVMSLFDYKMLGHLWKAIFGVTIGLLITVVVIGKEILGSTRWLDLGAFHLQPSEFAKIAVVIIISHLIARDKESIYNFKKLGFIFLVTLPFFLLVFLQPDLGTSMILLFVSAGIFWYAGLNKLYYLVAFLVVGVFSQPVWQLLKDYQKQRILVFLNPTLDTLGAGYNVIQSMIAVGSGQIYGRGFGRGTQSHLQFLPIYWTDFIFAAFSEEWGFIGVLGLVTLYVTLLGVILYISLKATDAFGSFLAMGVFIIFFAQFFINIGMNLGLMPVTGIPLALVSYGGSSLLTSMILLGIVHSVWINKAN